MSMFDVLKSNSRLATHQAKAKAAVASKDYNGPDGNVWVYLNRTQSGVKEGNPWFVFEFKVEPDAKVNPGLDSEFGSKLIIFVGLGDTDYQTAENGMDTLYETIQLLGIKTKDREDGEIEEELKALSSTRSLIELKVVTRKTKKGPIKNVSIVGLGEESKNKVEYDSSNSNDTVDPTWGQLADEGNEEAIAYMYELAKAAEVDADSFEGTWAEFEVSVNEVLNAQAGDPDFSEPDPNSNSARYSPSEWEEYEVQYNNETYTVTQGVDDEGLVFLEGLDEPVPFDDLVLPE